MKRAMVAVLAGTSLLASCGDKTAPEQTPAPGSPTASAPAPTPTARPGPPLPRRPVIPVSTEMAVYTIDSVVLTHPAEAPSAVAIKVSGTTRTGGWTALKLVDIATADNRADVKSYKFVATSPPQGGSTPGMQRARAEARLDSVPGGVTTIRVVSETNEVSAAIPR